MSRLRTILVVAAGLVLIASSAAHSLLGWPSLRANLTAENVPRDLISGLAMGWHFAGLAMLILGLLSIWLASVAQRSIGVRMPVGLIGVALMGYAAVAAAASGFDFIEIIFLTPGALLSAAALMPDR
jgi:hypothetical protein